MKQSAPFIYILNDWYNYGYVARILTTRVMLSVSEASEKEILHCVQNDKEDKPRNDNLCHAERKRSI